MKNKNNCKAKFIFFTLLLLFFEAIFARTNIMDKKFIHYNQEQGLSGKNVSTIIKDKFGFLWIGTYSSLNKFNGYEFKHFESEPNNSGSINNQTIYSLCKDDKGDIWIGTGSGGINRYNVKTGKFSTYLFDSGKTEASTSTSVQEIYQDSDNEIWAGTSSSLVKYNRAKNEFEKLNKFNRNTIQITNIYEDSKKRLWLGTSQALYYDQQGDKRFDPIKYNFKNKSISDVSSIFEDKQGNLWIASVGQGLFKIDQNLRAKKRYIHKSNENSLGSNYLTTITSDNQNRLWIGTKGAGINIMSTQKENFYHIKSSSSKPSGLTSNYILSSYKDENGILWFGTGGGGLEKYNPRQEQFSNIEHKDDTPNSLIDNRAMALTKGRDGTVWIGTGKGVNHYFPSSGEIKRFYLSDIVQQNKEQISVVKTIDMSGKGKLWIGTRKSGVIKFDPNSGRGEYFTRQNSKLTSNEIFSIQVTDHKVWIATNLQGLNVYDLKEKEFSTYTYDTSDKAGLPTNDLWSLSGDKNKIWIGTTNKGLIYFDRSIKKFEQLNTKIDAPSKLKIVDISKDKQGNVLACTNDGLLKYNSEQKKAKYILDEDSLSTTMLQSIIVSSDGSYWIGTDRGILHYNPYNKYRRFYTKNDGLSTLRFLDHSAMKDARGNYYFGTSDNGVVTFRPEELKQNSTPPEILITELKLGNNTLEPGEEIRNRVILKKEIYLTDTLQLSYKENTVSFKFTGLHSIAPGDNKYTYKLENFERKWNQVNKQRRARYTNLPSGEYVFKVKSANCDGVWNNNPETLRVIIPPPFWETLWFRLLIGLALVTGVFFIVRLRTKRLKQREEFLQKMNKRLNNEIQKKKQARRELEDTNQYIDSIINSMPSILISCDSDGKIMHWNNKAEEETGIRRNEILDKKITEVAPKFVKNMDKVWQAMENKEVTTIPEQKREVKGEEKYEKVTIYPLVTVETGGAVIIVDDQTEQRRLKEMMVQSEKMISVGGLSAGMAHEINNPLAGMMQNTSVIKKRLTDKEIPSNIEAAQQAGTDMDTIQEFLHRREILELLDVIHDSGVRIKNIIKNMLSFAQKGKSKYEYENVSHLLDSSIELAQNDYDLTRDYDFKEIVIEKEYSDEIPKIKCEPNKIEQVFFNIFKNGAEAMHSQSEKLNKKPKFILRTELVKNNVHIEIEDNGPGISEQDRMRVFEPFYTTSEIDNGTGLGLSISYFIITENHNGEMFINSEPGKGTTFIIELPLDLEEKSL